MNPTVCVHMGLMASACGATWGGTTECAQVDDVEGVGC